MRRHDSDLYHALCAYTLGRGDAAFVHQHVVDAYAAQHADEETKPITITFALIGLYLHLEKGYTGREVQRAHVALARQRRSWPTFPLPAHRGDVTVADVMQHDEGADRDAAINRWCASVWDAYRDARPALLALLASI